MAEILAPAGSYSTFLVALRAGADAVYLGGKDFGARKMASNFERDEMARAVHAAHLCGVKIYVTVNTLVADEEIKVLKEYLHFLQQIEVDAIIVQDVGVLSLARAEIPDMELHGSTQMTVHNPEGVRFWSKYGIKRVALARELSLEDIAEIMVASRETGVEIEVFVHGALCISYSGQCLFSSLIGGRSGNRGMCAQPCRLPYTLVDRYGKSISPIDKDVEMGEYLLSPKDLQAFDLLPELSDLGVHSFKIEGRMKRDEYVYTVTSAYKRALQAHLNESDNKQEKQDKKDIAQVFNRGFNTAYLDDNVNRDMMSDKRPNNRGVLVGRVESFDKKDNTVTVRWSEGVNQGDNLEIWIKVGGRALLQTDEFIMPTGTMNGSIAGSVSKVKLKDRAFLSVGDRVFRTLSAEICERVAPMCEEIENSEGFIPVGVAIKASLGQTLSVCFTDERGNRGVGHSTENAQKAQKRAMDQESLVKQCAKLGGTLFSLQQDRIECELGEQLFLPLSEINRAKRMAILALEESILSEQRTLKEKRRDNFRRQENNCVTAANSLSEGQSGRTVLTVAVDNLSKAKAALMGGADRIILTGEVVGAAQNSLKDVERLVAMTRTAGKEVVLAVPRIAKGHETDDWREKLQAYAQLQPDAMLLTQAGLYDLISENIKGSGIALWGDWQLNVYNSEALSFWAEQGLEQIALSAELTMEQLEAIVRNNRTGVQLECILHGRMPMMISEYCLLGAICGQKETLVDGKKIKGKSYCSKPCRKGEYFLKDRKDVLFPVFGDSSCRMQLFNAKELCMLEYADRFLRLGIKSLRIEGVCADAEEVGKWTALYRKVIDGKAVGLYAEKGEVTRGHYFRGVL